MENAQIADVFDEIADLVELNEGNPFRVRSYRAAAGTARGLSRRLEDLVAEDADLSELPNIGDGTASKILEILETGTCERLEEMRKTVPRELTRIMRVPGLGPRKAMQLYEELGVETLEDLEQAAKDERIRGLEGMGAKTEENILRGLRTLETTSGRFRWHDAADHVESIGRFLDGLDSVARWEIAGSFRRRKETVGDLDILVRASDRRQAGDDILDLPDIAQVLGHGEEKISVRLSSGLQVDFRFFEERSFGAALMYFTGSKDHNVHLRKRVLEHDWKLNEYGLFKGARLLAGASEDAVYQRMGLPWIPPELREDRGEIEAAEADALPDLITLDDIRGDLHAHTKRTDGTKTIEEMAEAARERGRAYLAITDHSRNVTMAHGLDEDALRRHAKRIRKANDALDDIVLLSGVEVDILESGELDLDEDVLRDLDWVVASVHYNRGMSAEEMTDRVVRAVESGVVDCIGHPLGRLIGKREPVPLDADRLFEACAEHGVCLEINSQPDRLDLPDTLCRRAAELGCRFVISTDAHKPSDFDFMELGVAVARRGWLTKEHVVNTRAPGDFLSWLEEGP
ncbi:MAG: DNA polymerase/3'-5' exonuclease PolX [Myxococcota bacterium]